MTFLPITDNGVVLGVNGSSAQTAIEFVMDGGGVSLTPGLKGYLEIPFDCIINRITILGDQTGSVVLDIWRTPYASFSPGTHPVAGDTITGLPTIASGLKFQDSVLLGWNVGISAGDVLAFNLNSVSGFQRLTVSLKVTK
jgi:hypothetical protein